MERYQVIDNRTGAVMGTYATFRRAAARRERLDMAYGAIRYSVRAVSV